MGHPDPVNPREVQAYLGPGDVADLFVRLFQSLEPSQLAPSQWYDAIEFEPGTVSPAGQIRLKIGDVPTLDDERITNEINRRFEALIASGSTTFTVDRITIQRPEPRGERDFSLDDLAELDPDAFDTLDIATITVGFANEARPVLNL
jgi:hypothetical protein